jgi:hypothetical protein
MDQPASSIFRESMPEKKRENTFEHHEEQLISDDIDGDADDIAFQCKAIRDRVLMASTYNAIE